MSGFLSSVQGWPWGPIITTVLGSGVVSALANNGFQWLKASREKQAVGRLTARRAAHELERYARELALAAEKWRSVEPYEQHSYGPDWPDVPSISVMDWTGFPIPIVDRVLQFDADHSAGRSLVRGSFDNDDDLGIDEAVEFSLRMGLQAWELAADLRRYAGFPPGTSRITDFYDYVEWMRATQKKRADVQAENHRRHQEMVELLAERSDAQTAQQ